MHGDARIEGYDYCMPLETLLDLNYNSFTLTVGIICVDSNARDMYGNSHSQGTYDCCKYHPCNIFRVYVHVEMRIYMSLKVYILPTLNLIFVQAVLNTVGSISNVPSLYQCSCKRYCATAVYAMW